MRFESEGLRMRNELRTFFLREDAKHRKITESFRFNRHGWFFQTFALGEHSFGNCSMLRYLLSERLFRCKHFLSNYGCCQEHTTGDLCTLDEREMIGRLEKVLS